MSGVSKRSESLVFALACLLGWGIAFSLYGSAILDPKNVHWIINVGGDVEQHFIGWDFFRRGPWTLPLGLNPRLGYEVPGASIVFTDSFPLFALLLKPFAAWLPDPFQYEGLQIYLALGLNTAFAALLLQRLTKDALFSLLGSCLFAFLPLVTQRAFPGHGHFSMMHVWLLEWSMLLSFTSAQRDFLARKWSWLLLLCLASLTHFYLFFMCLAIAAGHAFACFLENKESRLRLIKNLLAGSGLVLTCMWLAGYFSMRGGSVVADGFGFYSANLNSLFNPWNSSWFFVPRYETYGFSKVLPALPQASNGQNEGSAYLGLGGLVLFGCVLLFRDGKFYREHRWPLLAIAALALLAMMPNLTLGGATILHLPQKLFAPFKIVRSNGRLIWAFALAVLFLGLFGLHRRLPKYAAVPVLVAILALQLVDLSDWHAYIRDRVYRITHRTTLPGEEIAPYLNGVKRVVFLPMAIEDGVVVDPIAFQAARRNIATNVSYYARFPEEMMQARQKAVLSALEQGRYEAGSRYLLLSQDVADKLCKLPRYRCVKEEKYSILLPG